MPPTQCHIDPDMGEALAAVMLNPHPTTKHTPQAPAAAQTARAEMKKPDRPIMKEDSTDQDWAISEFEWGREDVVRPEILDCWDPVHRSTLQYITVHPVQESSRTRRARTWRARTWRAGTWRARTSL